MLSPDDEQTILELARSKNESERQKAHERLFREEYKPIYKLCFHLTGHPQDAEDAVQEVMLAAYRSLPRFRGEARLSTWLYRIAIRAALHIRARRAGRKEASAEVLAGVAAGDMPPDELAALREKSARLMRAMGRLTAEQRTVISLFAIDGLGHREIAEVLAIPEGTVWSRLHIARKKLAEALSAQ